MPYTSQAESGETTLCRRYKWGWGSGGMPPRDDQMRGHADGLGWVARADDAQACDSVRLLMAIAWLRGAYKPTAYYSIVITPPTIVGGSVPSSSCAHQGAYLG